ncbi:hypothetical protein FDUTEX481_02240 [Tolypothrix sp. PCC 7601]|nr:hypothetical protein FDUTEX481_02240 [Tolypothrix sp. PCC 7601]
MSTLKFVLLKIKLLKTKYYSHSIARVTNILGLSRELKIAILYTKLNNICDTSIILPSSPNPFSPWRRGN